MNTPDLRVNSIPVTPSWVAEHERLRQGRSKLLVVLSGVSEPAALAGRILAQARSGDQPVLLIGVASTIDAETDLHRRLVPVEAFIASQGHQVEIKTESGRDWLERVRREFASSDIVACYEHDGFGGRREPLSDVLARGLQAPVRDLTDFLRRAAGRRPILPQAAAWAGSILLIVGFLALQAKIVLEMQGWPQNVSLLMTIVAEVGLIWLWNSLLG